MQNGTNPGKLGIWTVLLLICVSTVGCGIVAAQAASPDLTMQENGQRNHLQPEPAYSERWNEVAEVCKGEADIAILPCQAEGKAKYMYFTPQEVPHFIWPRTDPSSGFCDVIGLFFCNGWCDKNAWLPALQSCLQTNNCESAPV